MIAGRFDGYVLCGGASRRMGRDKALVEVGGTAMARRVADALRAAGADRVVAVGGDAEALTGRGLLVVPDRWPGEGPLGGLITALDDADGAAGVAVVLACDLTAPDPAAIARLVDHRARADCDAVVPVVDGRRQWLHGAWDRRTAGILADVFAAGERSLVGAALSLRIAALDDVAPAAVRDADRPEDLPSPPSGAGTPSIGAVQVPEIDITTLGQKLDDGAPLFDVRQPDEYEQGHAPGARLVPLGEVPDRVGEFPTDETVYVICRSGGRSGKAVEHLRANGVDAVNVAGGTLAWVEAGNAVEEGG
jgi:molybdopterin-guanine dinucleotide biosynthesis protein A/rhodanese-related sulfurtransferase